MPIKTIAQLWFESLSVMDKESIFTNEVIALKIWGSSSLKDKNDIMERWGVQQGFGKVIDENERIEEPSIDDYPEDESDTITNTVATITVENPTETIEERNGKWTGITQDGWPEETIDKIEEAQEEEIVALEELDRDELLEIAVECGVVPRKNWKLSTIIKKIRATPGWGEE